MSEREGPCRAMVIEWHAHGGRLARCRELREHQSHDPANEYEYHQFKAPRPTLREWLRDAALWLAPPGWVIGIGLLASIVALALLFFDAVQR